jgi:hypothetical protein
MRKKSEPVELEFVKPKKFRDRSKKRRGDLPEKEHPIHRPYERENKNWTHNVTVDGLGDDYDSESDE